MKIKLLLSRFLLGLILAKGFIFIHPTISHSQSRTYICENSSGSSNTIANSGRIRTIIVWRPRASSTCIDVANRFEAALEEGNLRFLLKRGNDVCGTNTDRGNISCTRLLFTINEAIDPNSLLLRMLDGRERETASYLFQSSEGPMFSWQQYLASLGAN